MACATEMLLVRTVPDDSLMVPGYARHTFECPSCHDEEQRLVFTREIGPLPVEPMRLPPSSPLQASATWNATAAAQSAWTRAVAMLRGRQDRDR